MMSRPKLDLNLLPPMKSAKRRGTAVAMKATYTDEMSESDIPTPGVDAIEKSEVTGKKLWWDEVKEMLGEFINSGDIQNKDLFSNKEKDSDNKDKEKSGD